MFSEWILQSSTALHQTDENSQFMLGDYNGDGVLDVYVIHKRGQKSTEVHVLKGNLTYTNMEIQENLVNNSNSINNNEVTGPVWPVGGNRGTHIKNWPQYSDGSYHSGTDIVAPIGTPVYSTYDGVVNTVKSLTTSFGKHIIVKSTVNSQTVYMYYCHLSSMNVSEGENIKAGQKIGEVGSTGNSTGAHLHYEVRDSSNSYGTLNNPTLNPYNYLP